MSLVIFLLIIKAISPYLDGSEVLMEDKEEERLKESFRAGLQTSPRSRLSSVSLESQSFCGPGCHLILITRQSVLLNDDDNWNTERTFAGNLSVKTLVPWQIQRDSMSRAIWPLMSESEKTSSRCGNGLIRGRRMTFLNVMSGYRSAEHFEPVLGIKLCWIGHLQTRARICAFDWKQNSFRRAAWVVFSRSDIYWCGKRRWPTTVLNNYYIHTLWPWFYPRLLQ